MQGHVMFDTLQLNVSYQQTKTNDALFITSNQITCRFE